MLTFLKAIKITGSKYSIRDDLIEDLATFCTNIDDINTRYMIFISGSGNEYIVDLGVMLLDHPSLASAGNMQQLVDLMTPIMLYTYQTNFFFMSRIIRSFMSDDIRYPVVVRHYSMTAGDETDVHGDTSHRDLVIRSPNMDFSRVIPVINGRVRRCSWYNGKILLANTPRMIEHDFPLLSFEECDIQLVNISQHCIIPEEYVPIVVLCGKMFYDEPDIFIFDRMRSRIVLNEVVVMSRFRSHTDISGVCSDQDSFIILVKGDNLFIRDIPLVHMSEHQGTSYICYEKRIHEHHVDYIGIDRNSNTVRGLTTVDERYEHVHEYTDRLEHHVYFNTPSTSMRLIQLVAC